MIESEKHLCDLFKNDALAYGFRIFSEYEEWDLVLERHSVLIGVQAKLELNSKVIVQCLRKDNVHFKIIILPSEPRYGDSNDLVVIAWALKLPIFVYSEKNQRFEYLGFERNIYYYRHRGVVPCNIPDFDYDLPAGIRSPKTVSDRKIAFCRLEKIAKSKGFITWRDARDLGINKIPNMYFKYHWTDRVWRLRGTYFPSRLWPHIWENLNSTEVLLPKQKDVLE